MKSFKQNQHFLKNITISPTIRKQLRKYSLVFAFLGPALIGILLFQLYPLMTSIQNSFYSYNIMAPTQKAFIGFQNYSRMLHDSRLLISFINTFTYVFIKLGIQVPLALILALLFNRQIQGIGFVRSAVFAPTVTSVSIVAVIWSLLYQPDNGLINAFLNLIGIARQPFLNSTHQALLSVAVMSIWQDVGFTMLIFLGGLQNIPNVYLEAASIDGAGIIQTWRYIVIPLLKRTILFAIVITTVFSFKVFTPIYVMTQGGPENSTRVAVYYIWERAFKFLEMGYASAIAVVLVIVMIVAALLQNRLMKAEHEY